MKIRTLSNHVPEALGRALAVFEQQFWYPLGPGRTFRIEHGRDYPRFFRAMGEGVSLVAEKDGEVCGVVSGAERRLRLPDGATKRVVYVGDVKVAPKHRHSRTLLLLLQAFRRWALERTNAGYAVVMDGTSTLPTRYTGRLGIEVFRRLGSVEILRIPTDFGAEVDTAGWMNSKAENCSTPSNGIHAEGGTPACRSKMAPIWLRDPLGNSRGLVEDTRLAKRLIGDDGRELMSAHLSYGEWRDVDCGVALLEVALALSASNGFDALFVAVPPDQAASLGDGLGVDGIVRAPATVFGTGLDEGMDWQINTSEV